MNNLIPGNPYVMPDMIRPVSTGEGSETIGLIKEFYGPTKWGDLDVNANMPIEASTLARMYDDGTNQYMVTFFRRALETGADSWYFQLAPLERSEEIVKRYRVFSWDQYAMEPAPEDTSPRYVTFKSEEGVEYLTRYNLGARARGDWFKLPGGRAEMVGHYTTIVQGAWATGKMVVGGAVQNAKSPQIEWNEKYGTAYVDVMAAMNDEIRLFGALHDEQGFYKLNQHVNAVTTKLNPGFDAVVFAPGALDFFILNNKYELEASRRGEALIERRLTTGGRSLQGSFGLTIYEDEIFNFKNIGPDEFQHFTRIAVIGRYFMVDGSDFGEHLENYPASEMLSVQHASMDIDDYKKMTIKTILEGNMRFDPDQDGPNKNIANFARNVDAILNDIGLKVSNPDHVDPYIFRDLTYTPSGDSMDDDNSSGYHAIKYWGDMDIYYFTLKQNALFGKKAAAQARRNLTPKEEHQLSEMKSEMEKLYDVEDVCNESFGGYAFAVAANPENRPAGTNDFKNYKSTLLKANRFGCVYPPSVDKAPKRHNNKMIGGASEEVGFPVMYVQEGEQKQYVFALYPESNEIVLNKFDKDMRDPTNPAEVHPLFKPFWDRQGDVTRVTVTIPAQGQGLGALAQTAYLFPDVPAMYVLGKLDQFGDVNEKGEAAWTTKDHEALHTLKNRIMFYAQQPLPANTTLNAAAFLASNAATANNNNAQAPALFGAGIKTDGVILLGFKAPKLVEAPALPFGFGHTAGAHVLAWLLTQGNCRGWDKQMCEKFSKGVKAMDKYNRLLRKQFPDCIIPHEKYTPYYMKTADKEQNEKYSLFGNLWDHAKYSFWTRIPEKANLYKGSGGFMIQRTYVVDGTDQTDIATRKPQVLGFDQDAIDTVLSAMGFDFGNTDFSATLQGSAYTARETLGDLRKTLVTILSTPEVNPAYKEALLDEAKLLEIVAKYGEPNGLGSAYAQLLKSKKSQHRNADNKMGWIFLEEVVKRIKEITTQPGADEAKLTRSAATIFNTIIGLAKSQISGSTKSYTEKMLDQIIKRADAAGQKDSALDKRNPPHQSDITDRIRTRGKAVASAGGLSKAKHDVNESIYINTRLAISERPFKNMFSAIQGIDGTDGTQIAAAGKYLASTVRPSNPGNQFMPLAGNSFQVSELQDNADSAATILQDMTNLKYARAVTPLRLTSTIFGNTGLMQNSGSAGDDMYSKTNAHLDQHQLKVAQKYLDQQQSYQLYGKSQTKHLSENMWTDVVDGPFYTDLSEDSGNDGLYDSAGAPIDESADLVTKKWIKARFEYLSDTLSDDLARIPAQMLLFTLVTKNSLLTWVENNLPIPDACHIIAQPWIQIKTSSGLWFKKGAAGRTYYGHEDANLSYNAMHKTWLVHYTLWLGCMIYDNTKFLLLKDIKNEGYIRGMDDTINTNPEEFDPQSLDLSQVRSCFIFSCGATFDRDTARKVCNPMSLFGKYDRRQFQVNFTDRNRIFSPDTPLWPSAPYYVWLWRFHLINAASEPDYSSFQAIKESTYVHGIMPFAKHKIFDPVTGDYTKVIKGTGHLDDMEVPMRAKLAGKITYTKSF